MPKPPAGPAAPPPPLLSTVARAILIFVVIIACLALVLKWKPAEVWIHDPMNRVATVLSAGILRLAGLPAEVEGSSLVSDGFSMNILKGCNGVYAISIFLASVLAYPSRWTEKARGAVLGGLFLFLVNVGRVISLFLVGLYRPEWAEWFHVYFWQTGIVLIAILAWFFWEEKMVRHEGPG